MKKECRNLFSYNKFVEIIMQNLIGNRLRDTVIIESIKNEIFK